MEYFPQTFFETQMSYTQEASNRLRQRLAELQTECQCGDVVEGKQEQLVFMQSQMNTADQVFKRILTLEAKWKYGAFRSRLTPEEEEARSTFYSQGYSMLANLQHSFDTALKLPPSFFVQALGETKTILQTHPRLVAAGLVGGAIAGGCVGAGCAGFCLCLTAPGAIIAGAAAGAVVGFVFVGAIVLAYVLVQKFCQKPMTEEEAKIKELEHMLEDLENQDGTTMEQLEGLAELFCDCFVKPVDKAALASDHCPICHESFPANTAFLPEGDDLEPTKSVGCVGNHCVHKKCLRQWSRASGQGTCVICRQ